MVSPTTSSDSRLARLGFFRKIKNLFIESTSIVTFELLKIARSYRLMYYTLGLRLLCNLLNVLLNKTRKRLLKIKNSSEFIVD